MKKVLIVWCEIPDNNKLYIVDADDRLWELCNICHGEYIGTSGCEEAIMELAERIKNIEPVYNDNEVIALCTDIKSCDYVCLTGQIL